MSKQIKTLVLLTILIFNAGCSKQKPISISDCEQIKNEPKRDTCFAKLVESALFNDTGQNIGVCMKIFDVELRDLCLFKVAQDSWRNLPANTLIELCNNISAGPLRESCDGIIQRPHLQTIR